jgi:uncharacterized membrane protein YbaN (DUF454 family)
MTRYWKLKEKVVDCTLWSTCFGRGYGAVVRDYITNEMLDRFCNHLILRKIFNSCFQKWQRRGKSKGPKATICLHSFMLMITVILQCSKMFIFNSFLTNLQHFLLGYVTLTPWLISNNSQLTYIWLH